MPGQRKPFHTSQELHPHNIKCPLISAQNTLSSQARINSLLILQTTTRKLARRYPTRNTCSHTLESRFIRNLFASTHTPTIRVVMSYEQYRTGQKRRASFRDCHDDKQNVKRGKKTHARGLQGPLICAAEYLLTSSRSLTRVPSNIRSKQSRRRLRIYKQTRRREGGRRRRRG